MIGKELLGAVVTVLTFSESVEKEADKKLID